MIRPKGHATRTSKRHRNRMKTDDFFVHFAGKWQVTWRLTGRARLEARTGLARAPPVKHGRFRSMEREAPRRNARARETAAWPLEGGAFNSVIIILCGAFRGTRCAPSEAAQYTNCVSEGKRTRWRAGWRNWVEDWVEETRVVGGGGRWNGALLGKTTSHRFSYRAHCIFLCDYDKVSRW